MKLLLTLVVLLCSLNLFAGTLKIERIKDQESSSVVHSYVDYHIENENYFCKPSDLYEKLTPKDNLDGSWSLKARFKSKKSVFLCKGTLEKVSFNLNRPNENSNPQWIGVTVMFDTNQPKKLKLNTLDLKCLPYGGVGPRLDCPVIKMHPEGKLTIKELNVSW